MAEYKGMISLVKVSDGKQGEQGPAADEYRVETNQEEILKFYKEENGVLKFTFSPEILTFQLVKEAEAVANQENLLTSVDALYDSKKVSLTSFEVVQEVPGEDSSSNIITVNLVNYDSKNNYFYLDLSSSSEIFKIENNYKTEFLREKEFILKIQFKIEDKTIDKNILCRFGSNEDMAKFSLNASSINMAMQGTGLIFGEGGLEVRDGGFIITKSSKENIGQYEKVLYFDEGTGEFSITGNINAISGYFSGELKSPEGIIGGFNITNDRLEKIYYKVQPEVTAEEYQNYYVLDENGEYILAKDLPYDETKEYYQQYSLILNGGNGSIYADDIVLGTGAEIGKYIKLGNAYLYNPEENESRNILVSKEITLSDTGSFKIGSIEAFGGEKDEDGNKISPAYIKDEKGKWIIHENGKAEFKDIYADNVHLSNTILEIGTVQNVGSLMIFKDAWVPISFGTKENTTEEDRRKLVFGNLLSVESGGWIYNGENYYQIDFVSSDKKTITLTSDYTEDLEKPISNFGVIGEDFAFSVYGQSGDTTITNKKYDFASPYSITLSSFKENEEGGLQFTKNLILGKLDESGVDASGIGLYCDNVYLKGSLTAEGPIQESKDSYYSGIHTSLDISMPDFIDDAKTIPYFPGSYIEKEDGTKEYKTGNILLWAGAKGDDETSIKSAPFRVDSLGNFYAGSGYFKGSIISEATITAATMEAARMRTAILEGWEKNDQAALKIINTEKGIGFGDEVPVDGADPQYNEIFSINKTGFKAGEVEFIKIGSGISNIISNNLKGERKEVVSSFNENDFEVKYQSINIEGSSTTGFNFTINEQLKLKLDVTPLVEISRAQSIFETDMLFNKNISYSTKMTYKQVNDGYDLYVN